MGSALRARIPAIEVGPQKLPTSRGEGEHERDTPHTPTQIGGVEKQGREEGEGREHLQPPAPHTTHTTNVRPRMGKERSTREIAATPPRVEVPLYPASHQCRRHAMPALCLSRCMGSMHAKFT